MNKKTYFILFSFLLLTYPIFGTQSDGSIRGKVSENPGNQSIPGAKIEIIETQSQAQSDSQGDYVLPGISPGTYRIRFSAEGFETRIETDVIVRPKRITYLNIRLKAQLLQIKESVTVTESYFQKDDKTPTGAINISAEELRRMPGTAGFVSRMLTALPGVVARDDENSDLIVRGGSPLENGFLIDHIEVPYITHLPRLGSSGGAITAINPDLVQGVNFYSGGFSSNFGDRLSSYTNITLREGNRNEFDAQFDINTVMAGMVVEGPIIKGKGSWLASVRKSYINFLNDLGLMELDTTLNCLDAHFKLNYDFSPGQKLSLMNFTTTGTFEDHYFGTESVENNYYTQNSIGINWKSIWAEDQFSDTSLSFTLLKRRDREAFPLYDHDYFWQTKDQASYIALRNSNFFQLSSRHRIEFGLQIKHERDDVDDSTADIYYPWGIHIPPQSYEHDYRTTKSSLFVSYIIKPVRRITASLGMRGDYSSAHSRFHASPRFSLSLKLHERFSLNGNMGIFYQTLPLRFLAVYPKHIGLDDMKSTHTTIGFEYLAGTGTRIVVEAYNKEYRNLPIDPNLPMALASEMVIDSYYLPYQLTGEGRANSKGIELLIHQKLIKNFHGLISATYYRSRYHDLEGIERNTEYDNRFIINLTAGYKPNRQWELSARWTILGGRPRTPFDFELSLQANDLIFDMDRFREERYPNYNRLNIRAERRFYFGKSNLVVYIDLWNVLNHKNVYYYRWNGGNRTVESRNMLPLIPIVGIEFEF